MTTREGKGKGSGGGGMGSLTLPLPQMAVGVQGERESIYVKNPSEKQRVSEDGLVTCLTLVYKSF